MAWQVSVLDFQSKGQSFSAGVGGGEGGEGASFSNKTSSKMGRIARTT